MERAFLSNHFLAHNLRYATLRKAELPDIRFHDMRHTYAALSIGAGVDICTLSRRMGRSSIAVTVDCYGHLYQGNTQDVDALDRLLQRSD